MNQQNNGGSDRAESSDNEQWYGEEIAPALAEVAKKCQDRGVPFVGAVFYGGDESVGLTRVFPSPCLSARWTSYAAQCHRNLDSLFIAIGRDAAENNVDTSQSAYAYIVGWNKP